MNYNLDQEEKEINKDNIILWNKVKLLKSSEWNKIKETSFKLSKLYEKDEQLFTNELYKKIKVNLDCDKKELEKEINLTKNRCELMFNKPFNINNIESKSKKPINLNLNIESKSKKINLESFDNLNPLLFIGIKWGKNKFNSYNNYFRDYFLLSVDGEYIKSKYIQNIGICKEEYIEQSSIESSDKILINIKALENCLLIGSFAKYDSYSIDEDIRHYHFIINGIKNNYVLMLN